MIKLYSAKLSWFGRKVEIVLAEKHLAFERVQVPFSQTKGYAPKHADVLAANPKGQVPVLVDGDLTLYDSTIISEYLEDAYPTPSLFPRDAVMRAHCRQLEMFGDEIVLVPLRGLMHRNEPHADDDARWLAAEAKTAPALVALDACFAEIDGKLGNNNFLCGDLSVADICLFLMVLSSERLAGPDLRKYLALMAWAKRLGQRPAFAKIMDEIRSADEELSAIVAGAHPSRLFG